MIQLVKGFMAVPYDLIVHMTTTRPLMWMAYWALMTLPICEHHDETIS